VIPGLDVGKLVYFAVSVFWRAAVHAWRIGKRKDTKRLDLGPFAEALRPYLLGEASLPDETAVMVAISDSLESRYNAIAEFPALGNRTEYRTYRLAIPGCLFVMFVGKAVPIDIRRMATSGSGFLLISSESDEKKLQHWLALVRQAPRRGKFKAFMEQFGTPESAT